MSTPSLIPENHKIDASNTQQSNNNTSLVEDMTSNLQIRHTTLGATSM